MLPPSPQLNTCKEKSRKQVAPSRPCHFGMTKEKVRPLDVIWGGAAKNTQLSVTLIFRSYI